VTRTPVQLAALASSAVPGLDPVGVQGTPATPEQDYEVAFVTDAQHRQWVVRSPLTAVAGAQMDSTVALLGLLARRLPFAVPAPRGFVAVPEGRVVVYPHITGRPVELAAIPPGPGLAAELGRTLAAIHNVDRAVFDEAGVPAYDAEAWRARRLADLDRGASTGHVPTTLLARWERELENVSLWRFAPTPLHGDITGEQVLATFEDELDAATGRVRGVTGWDDAKVADPAEDFAFVVTRCDPETVETVLEAYAHHRVDRPDVHLQRRARLAAEMRLLTRLLAAVGAGRRDLVRDCAAELRDLDERTVDEDAEELEAAQVRRQEDADAAEEDAVRESEALSAEVGDAHDDPATPGDDPNADPAGPDRSGSEDTTIIPPQELARLRDVRVGGADDGDRAAVDDGDAVPGEVPRADRDAADAAEAPHAAPPPGGDEDRPRA